VSGPGPLALLPEERRLLWSLREVPPGRQRAVLLAFLDELVAFVREPHCPEMQADGVPCGSAGISCDQCRQVVSMLEELRLWIRWIRES
jgi:hypothetical protein